MSKHLTLTKPKFMTAFHQVLVGAKNNVRGDKLREFLGTDFFIPLLGKRAPHDKEALRILAD